MNTNELLEQLTKRFANLTPRELARLNRFRIDTRDGSRVVLIEGNCARPFEVPHNVSIYDVEMFALDIVTGVRSW